MNNSFNKWLDTFISEKNIDRDRIFSVNHKGDIHIVEMERLIELCKSTTLMQQGQIKSILVELDFYNRNCIDFFKHLAEGYVFTNF